MVIRHGFNIEHLKFGHGEQYSWVCQVKAICPRTKQQSVNALGLNALWILPLLTLHRGQKSC